MCWAKVDMVNLLPVERVLYLDADTLVCNSVLPLWETDLCGNPLAAVQDIGYPVGHSSTAAADAVPYFNAGVLLMDLAKIRAAPSTIESAAASSISSRLQDQDALNTHFRRTWLSLSLKWNAQGLGTYAALPAAERVALDLPAMTAPAIVHFTGPVHATMNAVLNDWGQPFTAKPWGYAGAPGHPYAEEWWKTLERTAWSGYRESAGYRQACELEAKKAEEAGISEFRKRVKESLEWRA